MTTLHSSFRRRPIHRLIVAGALTLGFAAATSAGTHTVLLAGGGFQGPGPLLVGGPHASHLAQIHTQTGHKRLAGGGFQGPGPLFVP